MAYIFIVVMNCHGYLYQSRPKQESSRTFYYVIIALGGFCGRFLVGICLPMISLSLIEYLIAFLLACLAITFNSVDKKSLKFKIKDLYIVIFYCLLTVAVIVGLPWIVNQFYVLNERTHFLIISGLLFLLIRWHFEIIEHCVLFCLDWFCFLDVRSRLFLKFKICIS